MEKRFQFRHVNELTGLFVIAVLALVVAGIVFSGQSQRWFARKFAFDVRLPEEGASGLRRGDAVFILGVSAGLVDDLRVGNNGRMTAHVKIRSDFERFVRVDSTASVKKVFGFAGDSLLEVTRGTGAPLPSGGSIVCVASEDSLDRVEKMLADLRAALMPVVQKAGATFDTWTGLGADLQKTQSELNRLVVRVDRLAAGIEEGKGAAGQLLTDTTLTDEAELLLARAGEIMSELQGAATNLNAAVRNVQAGTARLPEITATVANEVKDLPGLVQQTQVSMRELERLIEAVERHWLLRKYVNKTDPAPLRPLPDEPEPARKPSKPARGSKGSGR